MSQFLVTGASGFAGRYLIEQLLNDRHQVAGLVRSAGTLTNRRAREVVADLLDEDGVGRAVTEVKPDGIFHLGAPETSVGHSWSNPERAVGANSQSLLSVLKAARALKSTPRVL